MTLSEAIKKIQSINLSELSAEQKEAVLKTRDVFDLTTDPDELKAAGFDGDIMALAQQLSDTKPTPTPKKNPKREPVYKVGSTVRVIYGEERGQVGIIVKAYEGTRVWSDGKVESPTYEVSNTSKMIPEDNLKLISKPTAESRARAAKAAKASSTIKKAKADRKAKAKPRSKPVAAPTTKKAEAVPKPKTVKPKSETAADKATTKALEEIKDLDADIAKLKKKVNDNTGIVNRLAESLIEKGQQAGTLGALPDKIKKELMQKRKEKAILQRIIKRDANYFKSAANTLKKSNALTQKLESDLKSVDMAISDFKGRKAQEPKPEKKGILSKIFS